MQMIQYILSLEHLYPQPLQRKLKLFPYQNSSVVMTGQ